ncbi:hypothetical protein ACJRO7_019575 [Eucalyptus globulus]|uniref:Uncharacterized protein n=1 Tax=Eucalyptus globulus TaxID=34317 RepID=A0ABD3KKD3_EUCGL
MASGAEVGARLQISWVSRGDGSVARLELRASGAGLQARRAGWSAGVAGAGGQRRDCGCGLEGWQRTAAGRRR